MERVQVIFPPSPSPSLLCWLRIFVIAMCSKQLPGGYIITAKNLNSPKVSFIIYVCFSSLYFLSQLFTIPYAKKIPTFRGSEWVYMVQKPALSTPECKKASQVIPGGQQEEEHGDLNQGKHSIIYFSRVWVTVTGPVSWSLVTPSHPQSIHNPIQSP